MARLTGICFCAPARTERCAGDAQLARHGLTNHYSTLTVNAKKCPKLWVDPFIAFVRVGVFMIARAFSWRGERKRFLAETGFEPAAGGGVGHKDLVG